jgi:glycosyltransferase involved in cell wall biosynthesis
MKQPAVITAHPLIAGFAPLEWAGPVTFYCTDDWTAYYGRQAWIPAFHQAYAEIRRSRSRVCAVSAEIIERIDPLGPARVVPNGIDPHEWDTPGNPPDWLDALPPPRIVYIGTLDRRISIDLVADTAAAFPDGSVLLVGPMREPAHLSNLTAIPNVHIRPPLLRSELPNLLAGADVGVIPHERTRLTQAMCPLKAYEYLAAGCPVAAVDLPPLRNVDGRIVLASKGGFTDAVRQALMLGPASEAERHEFVARNAWANRHRDILAFALAGEPESLDQGH